MPSSVVKKMRWSQVHCRNVLLRRACSAPPRHTPLLAGVVRRHSALNMLSVYAGWLHSEIHARK